MEASALRAPLIPRRSLPTPLLKLRSDEQLVALFRAGSEEAFVAIHDRYRQRLFNYIRQMLSAGTRADAEDVLQEVLVRAYGALRSDARDLNLRAWLYRVAHNRCIDQMRRPVPAAGDVFELSRTPLQDPIEAAQRREDLSRLVADIGRLPQHQRSALLMREIDGLCYSEIGVALDVSVPAVKSLLVRARIGLVEAIEARDADCAEIRCDLAGAYERGVKVSGRARRHLRECDSCVQYRSALRGVQRSFAALSPIAGLGPLALAANALGFGGASGATAAGGAGTLGAFSKVAAVVCTAALATGTATEVRHRLSAPAQTSRPDHQRQRSGATAGAAPAPIAAATIRHRVDGPATPPPAARRTPTHRAAQMRTGAVAPARGARSVVRAQTFAAAPPASGPSLGVRVPGHGTGGATAPGALAPAAPGVSVPVTAAPGTGSPVAPAPVAPGQDPPTSSAPVEEASPAASPVSPVPPAQR